MTGSFSYQTNSMTSNHSDLNTLPIYKLYFDDIEEIFFNTVSAKYLLISTITTSLLTIASLIILLYRSKTIFLACLIPFVYSLIFYDSIESLSIILLKYNLSNISGKYFSELCRWPYYLKASSEAGQCLSLICIYAIRCQKVRYFLKHNHIPNSSRIHSRALTFVCLLFIVYVNNWITHLKVDKIHLITLNQSNYEINIQEYPRALYEIDDVKLNDHPQFYSDLDKYSRHYQDSRIRQIKPENIIHTQKDDSIHEILIKFPYPTFFSQNKSISPNRTGRKADKSRQILNKSISPNRTGQKSNKSRQILNKSISPNRTGQKSNMSRQILNKSISTNQTGRKSNKSRQILNKSISGSNSYRINRCTYGQRNFFLANFLSLIHSIFYFLLIIYSLTTIYRYKIPYMAINYHQNLRDKAFETGRRKSADHHKQLMLLIHLRHFQYLIVYCHTTLIVIRLIYICLLTVTLCLIQSPFQCSTVKIFFYSLFCIVYYSIPLRIILLFVYLFFSLFSSYINSIFYYIFRTKLHFSCKLQKPTIRLRFHIAKYHDEHSTISPNESITIHEENSSSQNGVATSSFEMVNLSEQS